MSSSRDLSPSAGGVVLWFARRAVGLALLVFVGPLAFAIFGVNHQYGHNDFVFLRTLGTAILVLGAWLSFGAHDTAERSAMPREDR